MTARLVSVALATWNGARYLRQQLDSVYAQTWPNLEVVVTDDASTDGTAEILQEYAERRGLRFEVNPERHGLIRNFERAISLCRGDCIALCDQDDLWKPEKIERLMAGLGDATLVYCNTEEQMTPEGEVRPEPSFAPIQSFARAYGSGRPTRHLLAENWVVSHGVLFRRELVAHALPIPPHQPYHDGWLALVASTLGGIRYLDERLQVYRQHPESLTWIPPERRGRRSGRFRATWRERCRKETERLQDASTLPTLTASDRAFLAELLTYHRSGLSRGLHWRSAVSGWRIAPYLATLHEKPGRWKLPVRALLGGL
ncbi:MAG TPA: glycosyltransferase family 2 protein [Thermoanaerobaculia bacterium]|nr:glycosyltransferase family 2 protein [Thermoanaerobaculia bacterium]